MVKLINRRGAETRSFFYFIACILSSDNRRSGFSRDVYRVRETFVVVAVPTKIQSLCVSAPLR